MSPLDLIYLAAAQIRASRGGSTDPKKSAHEWMLAFDLAIQGYALLLNNARVATAALEAATGTDPEAAPGLIVPANNGTELGTALRAK